MVGAPTAGQSQSGGPRQALHEGGNSLPLGTARAQAFPALPLRVSRDISE